MRVFSFGINANEPKRRQGFGWGEGRGQLKNARSNNIEDKGCRLAN